MKKALINIPENGMEILKEEARNNDMLVGYYIFLKLFGKNTKLEWNAKKFIKPYCRICKHRVILNNDKICKKCKKKITQ